MNDPIGMKLLDVAKTQLGYAEKSSGYTKFGDWYAKNIDHDSYFRTAPWCDMFLSWAGDQIGLEDSVGEFAATIEHAKWFKAENAWGHTPMPGAVVFFAWSGSKNLDSISHVGLVESVDGNTLHTIEANTSNALLRRSRDVSDVVGYGYPGKVKVAVKPAVAQSPAPKHAAPPPAVTAFTGALSSGTDRTTGSTAVIPARHGSPLPGQDGILTGVLAVVLCASFGLSVGKSTAAKIPAALPAPSQVRVRRRGRHHKLPVTMPADLTPADLTAAEADTAMMPALSAAVAAEVEDQEFWGRISHLEEDQELAFWNSLHGSVTDMRARSDIWG